MTSIIKLNKKNFFEFLKTHEFVLVKFSMKNCLPCDMQEMELMQNYSTIQERYKNIVIASLLYDDNKEIPHIFDIHRYPTLALWNNNKLYVFDSGLKKLSTLLEIIEKIINKKFEIEEQKTLQKSEIKTFFKINTRQ